MEKLDALKADGCDPFEITKFDVDTSCADAKFKFKACEAACKDIAGDDEAKLAELLEEKKVRVTIAGRIMSKRMMGKASFMDLRDKTDKIQVYVRQNEIGKDGRVDKDMTLRAGDVVWVPETWY